MADAKSIMQFLNLEVDCTNIDIFVLKWNTMIKVLEHLSIDFDLELLDQICKKHDIRPTEERVGQNIRFGSPKNS